MSSSSSSSSGGIGFFGLLTILFIGLKLTDTIDWSWRWVLAPLWIPAAIVVVVLLVIAFVWVLNEMQKDRRRKKKEPIFPLYIKVILGCLIPIFIFLIFIA